MNIKFLVPLCFLFVTLPLLESCKEPVRAADTSLLSGSWVVVNAKRNAKLTTTLNEAYFMFNADSTMQTNFMGEEITGDFKINGNVISHNSDEKLDYTIIDLSKDTLILSAKIMDYDFEFYLLNERLDPFNKNEEDLDLPEGQIDQIDIES